MTKTISVSWISRYWVAEVVPTRKLLWSYYNSSYLANISGSGVGLVFLSEGELDNDVLDLSVGGDGVGVAVDGNGHLRVGAEDQASQLLRKT